MDDDDRGCVSVAGAANAGGLAEGESGAVDVASLRSADGCERNVVGAVGEFSGKAERREKVFDAAINGDRARDAAGDQLRVFEFWLCDRRAHVGTGDGD